MRIKKTKLLKILYFFVFIIVELRSQNILIYPEWVNDILVLTYLAVYYRNIKYVGIKLSKEFITYFKILVSPWMVILIYSLAIQILGSYSSDYIKHSIMLCGRMMLYIVFLFSAYDSFRIKTPQYLLYACIVSYFPSIIKHFLSFGLYNGIAVLFSSNAAFQSLELEVHGLTYIFAMIAAFYFYRWIFEGKDENRKLFIISSIFVFLGLKRIAIAALAGSVVIILLLKTICSSKRRLKFVLKGALIMCPVAILFVWMIHDGIFEMIMNKYGVNVMGRFKFWSYFRDMYSISPSFLGRGISYSHRAMAKAGLYSTGLHNDVLGIYMNLGFFGSILYWFWYFYYRAKKIGKFSKDGAVFCVIVSLEFFIIFMVCNAGLNPMENAICCMLFIVMAGCPLKEKTNVK